VAELVDSLAERANSSDTGDRFWDNERKIIDGGGATPTAKLWR